MPNAQCANAQCKHRYDALLKSVLQEQRLDTSDPSKAPVMPTHIASGIASALQYLHVGNLVPHGALSIDNIYVSFDAQQRPKSKAKAKSKSKSKWSIPGIQTGSSGDNGNGNGNGNRNGNGNNGSWIPTTGPCLCSCCAFVHLCICALCICTFVVRLCIRHTSSERGMNTGRRTQIAFQFHATHWLLCRSRHACSSLFLLRLCAVLWYCVVLSLKKLSTHVGDLTQLHA